LVSRERSPQTAGAVITPRPARRTNQLPVPPALAAAHEAERQAHATEGDQLALRVSVDLRVPMPGTNRPVDAA
jgi:hypothetical protein